LGMTLQTLSTAVFDSEAASQATIGLVSSAEVWDQIGQAFGLDKIELDQFQKDFFSGDCLDLELVDFITRLRPAYKTALLSNAHSNARSLFTQTYHLDSVFDQFIISAEVKLAKPNPEIYRLACAQLEVQPAEMVFVDDFQVNIQGALSIGIQAFHFIDTKKLLSDLEKVL
jgi:epoxide hydrolase-like predicted phosphatase